DDGNVVAGEPDVAVLVLSQTVRAGVRRLERELLDLAGVRVEPAEHAGQLSRVPDRAVGRGTRVVRARARRRNRPLFDRYLDGAVDDVGGGSRPLRKAL